MTGKYCMISGALSLCLVVVMGAFGAHALSPILTTHGSEIWDTAVLYQAIHGLGLLFIGVYAAHNSTEADAIRIKMIGWSFVVGILLFSGSLYLLATIHNDTVRQICGPLTPLGGLCFILGWILTLIEISKLRNLTHS